MCVAAVGDNWPQCTYPLFFAAEVRYVKASFVGVTKFRHGTFMAERMRF